MYSSSRVLLFPWTLLSVGSSSHVLLFLLAKRLERGREGRTFVLERAVEQENARAGELRLHALVRKLHPTDQAIDVVGICTRATRQRLDFQDRIDGRIRVGS